MPKIKVTYTTVMQQVIDWPEDEMHLLTYENLRCNLDIEKSTIREDEEEILNIEKDGKDFDFE